MKCLPADLHVGLPHEVLHVVHFVGQQGGLHVTAPASAITCLGWARGRAHTLCHTRILLASAIVSADSRPHSASHSYLRARSPYQFNWLGHIWRHDPSNKHLMCHGSGVSHKPPGKELKIFIYFGFDKIKLYFKCYALNLQREVNIFHFHCTIENCRDNF